MLQWVFGIVYLLLLLYVITLLIRLVFEWIQVFARQWRPRGVVLLLAEGVYTLTDPPLRWLRQRIRPLRIGGIALDLGFLILMVACSFGLTILANLMARV
ncbi:MAG: YggT family protein [Beutenbergiaceae bacterium]